MFTAVLTGIFYVVAAGAIAIGVVCAAILFFGGLASLAAIPRWIKGLFTGSPPPRPPFNMKDRFRQSVRATEAAAEHYRRTHPGEDWPIWAQPGPSAAATKYLESYRSENDEE